MSKSGSRQAASAKYHVLTNCLMQMTVEVLHILFQRGFAILPLLYTV